MSNLSDLVESANDENADTSARLGAAIGTIADLAGALGAIATGAGILAGIAGISGLFSQGDDGLQKVLDAMKAMFDKVNDHIKAGFALDRLTTIDSSRGKAKAVFDVLPAAIDQKGTPGFDPVPQIQICREAVDDLTTNSRWLAVFLDQVYYDDRGEHMYSVPTQPFDGGYFTEDVGYGVRQPTPDANGDVFTYLYVLPSWIYAEGIFLTVAAALDDKFAEHYKTALLNDAKFLQTIHDNIAKAIQPLSPEPWNVPDLVNRGAGNGVSPVLEGPYSGNVVGKRIDYGAFELYTGVSRMATYELMYKDVTFHAGPINKLVDNPAVYQKFQIRLLSKQKQVYAAIGLRSVTNLILRLQSIVDPWTAAPTYGDWSFKELCAIAGTRSLMDMKKLLILTPPFDNQAEAHGFRALLS